MPNDYISVPQLAKALNVSVRTVRTWVYEHKVPFSKIGRLVRFSRLEMEKRIAFGQLLYSANEIRENELRTAQVERPQGK